jgi:hypothetical protein
MKRFLFLLVLTSSLTLLAQDSDSLIIDKKGFLRLHFLIPGIDYEQPLSNNFTLKFALQSGVGYSNTSGWEFTPYATAEQRYYFSFRKRRNYPNRDKYFSTLYLSLQENYIFETNDFLIGTVIGYQFSFARICISISE